MIVSIIDSVEEFARLGEEGADLAVVPATQDALTVVHEVHAEALQSWHFNSEQLLSGLHVPHSDIIERAGCEQVRVLVWETDRVDSLVVTGVTQLWVDLVSVAPVDGCLRRACEEMSAVSSERDRGH